MDQFSLQASDGVEVHSYAWEINNPKATIHIAHGMGEHARRYDWVATQLNEAGYSVYANDHRGHGETGAANLGYMGGDGWNRVLADAYELNQYIRARHADIPLILLGHSMGSMMSQQYITRYGRSIDALVLSGSPGFKQGGRLIPSLIAKFEAWRFGPDKISDLMQKLLFGSSNKPFDRPGATGSEWLSRDDAEVKKYVDDERCGFVLATGSLIELFDGADAASDPQCIASIPRDLPMYVFSGSEDPVHGEQADLDRMVSAYRRHGVLSLDYKLYPGGRHEMFNEVNKDEVIADLLTWLDKTCPKITKGEPS